MKTMRRGLIIVITGMAVASHGQTDFYKADNTTSMDEAASWVGGVVPGEGDRVWFSGNTANRAGIQIGQEFNWVGIVVTNSPYWWQVLDANVDPVRLGAEGIKHYGVPDGLSEFNFRPNVYLLANQIWHITENASTALGSGGDAGWQIAQGAIHDEVGQGPFSITKTGEGTLILRSPNSTFSGGLTIDGGSVQVERSNVLGTGTLTINGGTFRGGGQTQTNAVVLAGDERITGNTTLSGDITGYGSLTYDDGPAFKLTLNGDNSGFSGSITNKAILSAGHQNAFGTGDVVLEDGSSIAARSGTTLVGAEAIGNDMVLSDGTVTLGASATGGDFELAGDIRGDGGLQTAVLAAFHVQVTLSGENSYEGTTHVRDGSLLINGDNSGATGQVTISAGAALGGSGTVGGNVLFEEDAKVVFDPTVTLTIAEGKQVEFENFSVEDLVLADGSAIDWDAVASDTYLLIDGAVDFTKIDTDPVEIAPGRTAYFQEGSLQLVVTGDVPGPVVEPDIDSIGIVLQDGEVVVEVAFDDSGSNAYTLQFRTNLLTGAWMDQTTGSDSPLRYTNDTAQGFFRVKAE